MSRPTASPPPNQASGPNGDHRASQAMTTASSDAPARRVPARSCWARTGQERVVNVALEGPPPDQPSLKPFGGALRC